MKNHIQPDFLYRLKVLTEELIITKADIDFETHIAKREYAASLEKTVMECLR